MKKFFVFLALVITCNVNAQVKTPAEKMMIVMGFDKILHAQRLIEEQSTQKQLDIIMKQLSPTLARLPPETTLEIKSIINEMIATLLNSWDIETAIKIYSEVWNKQYSEAEINAVIIKYQNPKNNKELETALKASNALTKYITDSYTKATEDSMAVAWPKIQNAIIKGKQKLKSK